MMIGRAGGWMEWSGAVKGRAGGGDGDGDGRGRGEGGRGGEGQPFHFIVQQHDDGIVRLLLEKTRVLLKHFIAHL